MVVYYRSMKLDRKNIIIFLALFVILLLGVTLLMPKKNKERGDFGTKPNMEDAAKSEVDEELKDGVYINHTFGFSFEYPKVFNKINPWLVRPGHSDKEFFVEGQRFPQLSVALLDVSVYENTYSQCVSAQDGSIVGTSTETGTVAIKRYSVRQICVTEVRPRGNGKVESGWSHVAIIPVEPIENYRYLYVSLSESDENALSQSVHEFDSIVQSLKFFN